MRAVILINPNAGRGRAARIGAAADRQLRSAGHETLIHTIGRDPDLQPEDLGGADALVVVGGDGTVHHAADVAVESGVPIYHAASGNENLFAREFGMRPDPRAVLHALEHASRETIDRARCNGASFLIMCSVGPDASVIHRLTQARRKPTGHLAYTRPVIAEAFSPQIPRVRIEVDGKVIADYRRGVVVVANSRQYALRVDPCPGADVQDAMLDVAFLPCSTSLGAVVRLTQCRLRVQGRFGSVLGRGERVRIEIEGEHPQCQLDGEAPISGSPALHASVLECRVEPRALPVLVPKAGR